MLCTNTTLTTTGQCHGVEFRDNSGTDSFAVADTSSGPVVFETPDNPNTDFMTGVFNERHTDFIPAADFCFNNFLFVPEATSLTATKKAMATANNGVLLGYLKLDTYAAYPNGLQVSVRVKSSDGANSITAVLGAYTKTILGIGLTWQYVHFFLTPADLTGAALYLYSATPNPGTLYVDGLWITHGTGLTLRATLPWDPLALTVAPGSFVNIVSFVSGAQVQDSVSVAFSIGLVDPLIVSAYIPIADNVRVIIFNPTVNPIVIAGAVFDAYVEVKKKMW